MYHSSDNALFPGVDTVLQSLCRILVHSLRLDERRAEMQNKVNFKETNLVTTAGASLECVNVCLPDPLSVVRFTSQMLLYISKPNRVPISPVEINAA